MKPPPSIPAAIPCAARGPGERPAIPLIPAVPVSLRLPPAPVPARSTPAAAPRARALGGGAAGRDPLDDIAVAAGAMLGPGGESPLGRPRVWIAEGASHDFAAHVFLLDPFDRSHAPSREAFRRDARAEIHAVLLGLFLPPDEGRVVAMFEEVAAAPLFEQSLRIAPGYPGTLGSPQRDLARAFGAWFAALFEGAAAPPLFDHGTWQLGTQDVIARWFPALFPAAGPPREGPAPLPLPPYYSTGVVNFGLRLVYRQEWRPLGTQPTEIVKTIPLAPRQTERVAIHVVRTDRRTASEETATASEAANERGTATKDSRDVVSEASAARRWHVEAEASASFFFGSASLAAGYEDERASSSKNAKSHLGEVMSKTASRMTRSSRVTVTVDSQRTAETTTSSEITNPNDEVPVTYVYTRLARQYEIHTYLAEVTAVAFVAEPVPARSALDAAWLDRHGWLLRGRLLDPALEDELAALLSGPGDEVVEGGDVFLETARAAQRGLAALVDVKVATLGDVFSPATATYERHLERQAAARRAAALRKHRLQRVLDHVADHVLHYLRVIWQAEDGDARMLRYAHAEVPARWRFEPGGGGGPDGGPVEGAFVPDMSAASLRPLSELIDPTGPIGFAGNYTVLGLRGDATGEGVNAPLDLLRATYQHTFVRVAADPGALVNEAFVRAPRRTRIRYELVFEAAWRATLPDGSAVAVAALGPTELEVEGVRIRLRRAPTAGATLVLVVTATAQLEDPELRALRVRQPLPLPDDEPGFFDRGTLTSMVAHLPELEPVLGGALAPEVEVPWDALAPAARTAVRDTFHRYLLTRDHTRRLLVDTNNLLVDVEVGATSILEEFRRLHRAVDVVKETEEARRRGLDNERRARLLAADRLADPDIEHATVISADVPLVTLPEPGPQPPR